jgi:membrane fusion protein (multidrug efflux system)
MFLRFKYLKLPVQALTSLTLASLTLASLALATLSLASCGNKNQGMPPFGPAPVSVVTIKPERLPLFTELPGRTSAFRVAEVRPQVGGIIQKRLFAEGGDVKAGQQLYQIDPATYQAALQSAEANLAKARANLKSVAAKADRYAELVKINAVSRQDYDDATANLDQAKAQIMVADADAATARINLGYTRVYAPISGRIGKSSVTEGALVTANQTSVLATVTQLDPIYVDVSQSSSELMQLRNALATGKLHRKDPQSATVTLTLDNAGDGTAQPYAASGKLQFSDVTVDPSTGAVQLRAVFPNPHHDLLPGLFVRARVEQGVNDKAILVPQQALVRAADNSTSVWVVGQDNKVELRPVEIGQAVGDKWLVTAGLQPGNRVVLEGLQKIHPGAEVRIQPTSLKTAPIKTAPASKKP